MCQIDGKLLKSAIIFNGYRKVFILLLYIGFISRHLLFTDNSNGLPGIDIVKATPV